ncbi:hypothetical protein CH35J_000619 [Colletotrichum higginsianum]|uniref:Pyrroloquinoline quinone-dependent pyranose dehydrogenase beta-propeller domain-containing protein n=1 Tax=Colletotrichum higginsianum TaxID=80884 RepID=A0A4V4NE08_9PEZI|nr:hypothetical protein CH35J_000619 [Colletotrichum higginsianum]
MPLRSKLNHGIALSPDGKTLYASTVDKVYAWSYDAIEGVVNDSNRTLVANMSNTGHTTRTLPLSNKKPGIILVSRGSAANIDQDAARQETGHSQLRAFDIGNLGENSQPFDFTIHGTMLEWGLRNSVGIAEEPVTGGIWTVENSADQLRRNGVDIHRDNPAEELNFHGYLDNSAEKRSRGPRPAEVIFPSTHRTVRHQVHAQRLRGICYVPWQLESR